MPSVEASVAKAGDRANSLANKEGRGIEASAFLVALKCPAKGSLKSKQPKLGRHLMVAGVSSWLCGDSKTSPLRVRPTHKGILSRSGGSMSEQTRSTRNGSGAATPREVLVSGDAEGFTQEIVAGPHQLTADEPKGVGGTTEDLCHTIYCSRPWGRAPR